MSLVSPISVTELSQNPTAKPQWQQELAQVVTDPEQLLTLLELCPSHYRQHHAARKLFPVRVPRAFIARMQTGNIDDPLLKQVMANAQEFEQVAGFVADPLQEHDTVAEGLLHKYRQRVLMIVKAGCAVNCRYCFRRHFPYRDNSPNKQRWQPALDYIANHTEINEVIFSGGDPLMASDEHLAWLIEQIEAIGHISRLRIHTRLPIVIPSRITERLCQRLAESRLKIIMVLHCNHANEIDSEVRAMSQRLRQHRLLTLNQAVLLKGINDSVDAQVALCEQLFAADILPYYLHMLDPVAGTAHFNVSEADAQKLVKQMLAELPGFLMPKLVREIAGEPNKTPINLR